MVGMWLVNQINLFIITQFLSVAYSHFIHLDFVVAVSLGHVEVRVVRCGPELVTGDYRESGSTNVKKPQEPAVPTPPNTELLLLITENKLSFYTQSLPHLFKYQ